MKPYAKTFRYRKDHKASECSICAEQIKANDQTANRRKAKEAIYKEILICKV